MLNKVLKILEERDDMSLEDAKDFAAMLLHTIGTAAIHKAYAAVCHTFTQISWAVPDKCIDYKKS